MPGSAAGEFGRTTPLKLAVLRTALGFDGEFSAMDVQRALGRGEDTTYKLLNNLTDKGWLTSAEATVRPRTKGGSATAKVYTFTDRGRQRAQEILDTAPE